MPRKGRKRSSAQIRQTEVMRKGGLASRQEVNEISEVYRCMTMEEYRDRMAKAEREVKKGQRDLYNAERRLERMTEKVGGTKRETEDLEHELDQVKKQLETATAKCTWWEGRSVELRRALQRIKAREHRGPKAISCAVQSAISTLANSSKPLTPPLHRVEGRIYKLVNELAFSWCVPTSIIAGVIDSVSRATVDVCYGGHADDVSIDMGEHHELDEHENEREGSPVMGVVVVGPSSAAVPPPEESSM